jgi:ABC-type multidrug transport system fused ATPase/permease subunit
VTVGFFDSQKSGDLVSRLGTDTLLVQQATTSSLNEFFIGLVKVIGGVTLMFHVCWEMALIVFCTIVSRHQDSDSGAQRSACLHSRTPP